MLNYFIIFRTTPSLASPPSPFTGTGSTHRPLKGFLEGKTGMKINTTPFKLSIFAIMGILLFLVLSSNEVDNSITEEDKRFIPNYLESIPPLEHESPYKEEIEIIKKIQDSVLTVAPNHEGLPYNTEREPKDVYVASKGLCYDRSRVIEKILRYSGFDTRHISMYSTTKTHSAFKSLMTPGVPSHAVTEVLTKRGWLVVDSNNRWLSIDSHGNPLSIAQIKLSIEGPDEIPWRHKPPSIIYQEPFTFIYGLYSRHGKFYPPYNFIPDVNYEELLQNFL
jgi:hypothetical protein